MMSALGRYTGLDVERGSRTAGILSASGAAKIRRRQLRRSASGPCAERLAGFKELSLAKREVDRRELTQTKRHKRPETK